MLRAKAILSLLLVAGVVTAGVTAVSRQERDTRPQAGKPQAKEVDRPADRRRTDRHGDPLPEGAVARLGTLRWRAGGEIHAMAFSPDGKTIASVSQNGVGLFDASGKRMKNIRLPGPFFDRLAFSADGKRLACRGRVIDRRVREVVQVWELLAGRKVQEFSTEGLVWLGWSAEDEPLAVVLAKGVVLFRELAAGTERRFEAKDLPTWADRLSWCAYAPQAKVLAVADQRCIIHVWDVPTGKKRCALEAKGRFVRSLALSSDGKLLASLTSDANDKRTAQLWDVATGKATHAVAASQRLGAVAFAPDGKTLATVGWDDVRFWDVTTGRESGRARGVPSFAENVAFSPDGKTLATAEQYSGAIHLCDVPTGALKPEPTGHTNPPGQIAFSPDGRRVATAGLMDGAVFIWDPATCQPLARIRHGGLVRGCAFSSDGRTLLSCGSGETLTVSDAATGRQLHTLKLTNPDRPDHQQSCLDMRLSEDGKTLVAFSDSELWKGGRVSERRLLITGWDPVTRKPLFRRQRVPVAGWPVVSPDVKVLALEQGTERAKPKEDSGWGPIRLEDLRTGEHLLSLPRLEGQTRSLAFSPDGRLLATNTSRYLPADKARGRPEESVYTLRLWELESAGEVLALPTVLNARVAFSPDGCLLALSTPSEEILLWDMRRGKELRRLKGFDAEVSSLAFSPDGKRLVSGLADSTLLVWDVADAVAEKPTPLDAAGAVRAWADLAGESGKAFAARGTLASSPEQAVALLRARVKPVQPADPSEVRRLIAALDGDTFEGREKARKALETLGDRASGELHEALKKKPSLEAHRRLQALLARLRPPVADPEMLRALRGVAVLEDIGTLQARQVLRALAGGAAGARLTQQAKAALERLARRSAPRP